MFSPPALASTTAREGISPTYPFFPGSRDPDPDLLLSLPTLAAPPAAACLYDHRLDWSFFPWSIQERLFVSAKAKLGRSLDIFVVNSFGSLFQACTADLRVLITPLLLITADGV